MAFHFIATAFCSAEPPEAAMLKLEKSSRANSGLSRSALNGCGANSGSGTYLLVNAPSEDRNSHAEH